MTKALCWHCGEFKFGAFNPCLACDAIPRNEDEIMISLLLTDHYHSEDELELLQARIRGGARIEIDEETRIALLPVVDEVTYICGIASHASATEQIANPAPTNFLTSRVVRLHRLSSKGKFVSILFFHAWRTSAIVVLLLAIYSAFQGDLIYLWNPLAFGSIILCTGYSFASVFLGRGTRVTRFLKCRSHLVILGLSLLTIFLVNSPSWSLPLIGLSLSATSLALWALCMGVLSALRGDFDTAMMI